MRFSPPIDPTLVRLVGELDDGSRVIAAVWRELGRRARARALLQPSYESVRRLVHRQRAARRVADLRARRAAVFVVDRLLRTRNRRRIVIDRIATLSYRSGSLRARPP